VCVCSFEEEGERLLSFCFHRFVGERDSTGNTESTPAMSLFHFAAQSILVGAELQGLAVEPDCPVAK
jgi:hypothetical protein